MLKRLAPSKHMEILTMCWELKLAGPFSMLSLGTFAYVVDADVSGFA